MSARKVSCEERSARNFDSLFDTFKRLWFGDYMAGRYLPGILILRLVLWLSWTYTASCMFELYQVDIDRLLQESFLKEGDSVSIGWITYNFDSMIKFHVELVGQENIKYLSQLVNAARQLTNLQESRAIKLTYYVSSAANIRFLKKPWEPPGLVQEVHFQDSMTVTAKVKENHQNRIQPLMHEHTNHEQSYSIVRGQDDGVFIQGQENMSFDAWKNQSWSSLWEQEDYWLEFPTNWENQWGSVRILLGLSFDGGSKEVVRSLLEMGVEWGDAFIALYVTRSSVEAMVIEEEEWEMDG